MPYESNPEQLAFKKKVFKECQDIARKHKCFCAEKNGVFLLYRNTMPKNVFLGKRRTISAFKILVKRVCNDVSK